MPDTLAVKTDNLTLRFGQKIAVNGMNISVSSGEIFGLLGPNGAGKTSTIKMLTTLTLPSAGSAEVAGFDIVKQSGGVRRSIGYVPQLMSTDGGLTGYENMIFFAKIYDVPRKEQKERVAESLAVMGLENSARRLTKEYSGGMLRRLEIAQSLLHHPKVLFLDEPTTGLDPLARKTVWERLAHVRATFGTTIFLTTHLMHEAEAWCDHVAVMHTGKVAAIGTPAELVKALNKENATLDDVFIHYGGSVSVEDAPGDYRRISKERRQARRLN